MIRGSKKKPNIYVFTTQTRIKYRFSCECTWIDIPTLLLLSKHLFGYLLCHNMNANQKCVTLNFFNWFIMAVCLAIHWHSLYQCREEESEDRKREEWSEEDLWAGGQSRHCLITLLSDKGQKRTASSRNLYVIPDPDNLMFSTCSLMSSSQPDLLLTASPLLPSPGPSNCTYLCCFLKSQADWKHLTDFKRHSV